MTWWHRVIVVAVVVAISLLVAKLVDMRISRRKLKPGAETRYQILRRSLTAAIVLVGILSALLVIPQVRAVAGGILASSAVLGLIIGFAAQRTIGNAIAGILIAFSQPLRLGDQVMVDDVVGIVEEIALTYTFIRAGDGTRLVIPNEKLASDSIRNFTIGNPEKVAEITVQVPLQHDLDALLDALRAETTGDVYVSSLDESAVITVSERAHPEADAERLTRELRLRAHRRLRAAGAFEE